MAPSSVKNYAPKKLLKMAPQQCQKAPKKKKALIKMPPDTVKKRPKVPKKNKANLLPFPLPSPMYTVWHVIHYESLAEDFHSEVRRLADAMPFSVEEDRVGRWAGAGRGV